MAKKQGGKKSNVPAKSKGLPKGVIPFNKYEIAAMDRKELKSLMAETLGALDVTEFDLERIVVPTGGGLNWQIANAEGETDTPRSFDAVILNFAKRRSFYEESYEESGGGSPPDCSSSDCLTGEGNPGGSCNICPNAQFGSSKKPGGLGQACSQNMFLFIVRPDEIMPSVLKIPPTSIRAISKAIMRVAFKKRVHYYHALIRFCLGEAQNANGVAYSEIKLKFLGKIDNKEQKQIAAELHNGLTPLIEGKGVGQAFLPAGQASQALPPPPAEERLLDDEPQTATEEPATKQAPPEEPDGLPDAPEEPADAEAETQAADEQPDDGDFL